MTDPGCASHTASPAEPPAAQPPAAPAGGARFGWQAVALVALGGAAGAVARTLVGAALPVAEPLSTALINTLGSFVLGVVVGTVGRAPRLQLLLGAGFCGGFTTYSAFALAVASLVLVGAPAAALALGLGTVLVAGAATLAGLALGGRVQRARHAARGRTP